MDEAAHAPDPQRLRARLDTARARLGRDLGEGRPGRALTAAFSHAIRELLVEAVGPSVRAWDPAHGRLCVVEIGSIARDQLCPHADVDLVVLCERSHGEDEAFAFRRAASRLHEMQSDAYLGRSRAGAGGSAAHAAAGATATVSKKS